MEWLEQLQDFEGPPLLLAFLIAVATLFSEDAACIAAGILSAQGWIPLPYAIGGAGIGILSGDLGLYAIGYLSQKKKHSWRWLDRLVSEKRVAMGRRFFDKHGTRWIFLSRFLPGSRVPSYIAAGAVGWSFPRYATALAIAVSIWTPVLVSVIYYSGQGALALIETYQKWVWPIFLGLIFLLFLLFKVVIPLFSWRGRQRLRGRWRRLTHWEYWPAFVVYPLALAPLILRRLQGQRVLDFLLCNPAMPLSGFAMESKGDILDGFNPPRPESIRIADYTRFQANGLEAVQRFASQKGYPLVLKPDIGERGSGVAVIRSEEEARDWLANNADQPALAQEYITGLEVGVHWARDPGSEQGEVSSLARKLPQSLIGNGEDTIEQLILKDKRAVAMARHFLKQFAFRLDEIPPAGETIVLTELGTHCLGAIFEDAREDITPELRETLDQAGSSYEGFHFGRYDIRVPNEADLKAGRGLVILELNGVTGEPAHIYQPDYPLLRGLKDLRLHYQRASEIGASLREQGQPAAQWKDLLQVIHQHRNQDEGS